MGATKKRLVRGTKVRVHWHAEVCDEDGFPSESASSRVCGKEATVLRVVDDWVCLLGMYGKDYGCSRGWLYFLDGTPVNSFAHHMRQRSRDPLIINQERIWREKQRNQDD